MNKKSFERLQSQFQTVCGILVRILRVIDTVQLSDEERKVFEDLMIEAHDAAKTSTVAVPSSPLPPPVPSTSATTATPATTTNTTIGAADATTAKPNSTALSLSESSDNDAAAAAKSSTTTTTTTKPTAQQKQESQKQQSSLKPTSSVSVVNSTTTTTGATTTADASRSTNLESKSTKVFDFEDSQTSSKRKKGNDKETSEKRKDDDNNNHPEDEDNDVGTKPPPTKKSKSASASAAAAKSTTTQLSRSASAKSKATKKKADDNDAENADDDIDDKKALPTKKPAPASKKAASRKAAGDEWGDCPRIVISGANAVEKARCAKIIARYDAELLDQADCQQSHCIVYKDESGEYKRTLKVLFTICHRGWVVSSDYVDDTEQKKRLPVPERFELAAQFPGAQLARLGVPQPLRNVVVFFVPGNAFSVDIEHLRALVRAAGGQVTTSLADATVAMGKSKTPLNIPCVTEQYVLDAISTWQEPSENK